MRIKSFVVGFLAVLALMSSARADGGPSIALPLPPIIANPIGPLPLPDSELLPSLPSPYAAVSTYNASL